MKTCNTCHESKPLSEFYVNRRWKDGLDNKCKSCHRMEKMARYWKDPEAARARQRVNQERFRAQNPQYQAWAEDKLPGGRTEYFRRAHRKRTYGLEHNEFVALLESQDGKCAICKRQPDPDPLKRQWNVDHDHITGAIRGILCRRCNLAIGHFDDNIELLRSAIKYLSQHHG